MALSPKSYLADLKVLQEIKDLRGWEDDDPQWVRMLKGLDKRAAGKLPAPNPLGDSAPKVKALFDWNTVGSKKYASWLKSEAGLKDIYDGDWKPDPNSRGGLVTFKKEKCPWKRRIAKEKANGEEKIHYGRIIFHKGTHTYYIQEGTLKGGGPKPDSMEEEEEEEEEWEEAPAEEAPAEAPAEEEAAPKPSSSGAGSSKKAAKPPKPAPPEAQERPKRQKRK